MRVLIDTNIILDWLMCREPFHDDSRLVMKECMFGDLKGYISAHTLTDLFYILRKDFVKSPVPAIAPERIREMLQKPE